MASPVDGSAELFSLLARHTGFALTGERGQRAHEAIRHAMNRTGISDGAAYLALIQGDPHALDGLVAEILVGETYFLREPAQWTLMREIILGDLTSRCGPDHVLRCWSAGCASGDEAYSLAIVLEEAGLSDRANIVGTDISRAALTRAREASYTSWSLRNASAAFADRWFERRGQRYLLDARVRSRVRFEYLNLATAPYPAAASGIGAQDLILCRNVLLYFDRETTARVVEKLYASLAPGGWLVCGSSDPSPTAFAPFEAVVRPEGVLYRRPLVALVPLVSEHGEAAPPITPAPAPVASGSEPVAGALATGSDGTRSAHDAGPPAGRTLVAQIRADAATEGSARAERTAAAATARYPLDPELHYLRGMLLLELGRLEEALAALRRVLYLDRTLAVAHFTLGVLQERMGHASRASGSYRNAARLASARPADERAPLSDGEDHQTIAAAARRCVERLAAASDRAST